MYVYKVSYSLHNNNNNNMHLETLFIVQLYHSVHILLLPGHWIKFQFRTKYRAQFLLPEEHSLQNMHIIVHI